MDDSKSKISDFELFLQKQSFKKPSFLYNTEHNASEQTYKPQDVIKTVNSQIKAYQLADSVRSGKCAAIDLKNAKKSDFLPLNKLPVYGSIMKEVSKVNPHKFETQCVLDTQLIDIIDGAATVDTNTGMTQEFDTTFTHNDDVNSDNTKFNEEDRTNVETHSNNDGKHTILDKTLTNVVKSSQNKEENNITIHQNEIENQSQMDHNIAILDGSIDVNLELNSQLNKTATENTVTFFEDLSITQDKNEEFEKIITNSKETDIDKTTCGMETDIDTRQDKERSPSPVLNTNVLKRKLKTPPPIIVPLDKFENFENIAMSLIEETDFETAKQIINSQILGKELCLNDETEIILGTERDNSPVLDFKSDELQFNSNELMPVKKANEPVSSQDIEDMTKKPSEVLEDEILFSSDEEDFADKDSQILPPTCVLETSNDQTDIPEKSIFVGFQTASNKSIQISRDSYKQAQSILINDDDDDDNSKSVEEFSLTDLIEKCDNSKPKIENITNTTAKNKESSISKAVELNIATSECEDRLRKVQEHNCNERTDIHIPKSSKKTEFTVLNSKNIENIGIKKQSFKGFMTASNKKICMSDKAFNRCQKVFTDIDLHEDFDAVKSQSVLFERNSNNTDDDIEKTEEIKEYTDDKINDELLLEEFENIEMSLEEKESNSGVKEPLSFECFKTDNNEKITISKEATKKSKNVFQDIDVELSKLHYEENIPEMSKVNTISDINQPSTSKAAFVGFKTANNKEIRISDEALAKSKDVFKEIGKDKYKIKTIDDIISQPTTSTTFVGFKTANNKDIKLSNDALAKTKNIFKDIDNEHTKMNIPIDANQPSTSKPVMLNTGSNEEIDKLNATLSKSKNNSNDITEDFFIHCEFDEPEPIFKGFKSPSDTEIKISQQAVEKRRKLFNDIIIDDNDSSKNKSEEIKATDNNTKGFLGFKTASNKEVKVSVEAVERSKKIFSELDTIDPDDENEPFKGFQTASEKLVTVSAHALAISKLIFKDIHNANDSTLENIPKNDAEVLSNSKTRFSDLDPIDSNDIPKLYTNKNKDVNTTFKGFQTASKKHVTVSAEALAKSKRIFNDIDEVNDVIPEKIPKNTNFKFTGFQMGNRKPDDINKEVFENKTLVDDVSKKIENSRNFIAFKTASNKNVNVSEEALAKCKKIFDDIEDISITAQHSAKLESKEDNLNGCLTANQAKVDTLKKAKNLFDDVNDDSKQNSGKSFVGFQTANNNKVTVSKQALAKSKQLFQDIDTESDIIPSKKDSMNTKNATQKCVTKQSFGFKNISNKDIAISKEDISEDRTDSRKLFTKPIEKDSKQVAEERKTALTKNLEKKEDKINIGKILNTQVINDFQEDVCTEDFKETSRPNKRSGSPILMCPKAKKKKFETPYRISPKTKTMHTKTKKTDLHKDLKVPKPTHIITFREDYKKNKKYTLKDLTDLDKGKTKEIDPYLHNFTLENILDFEFNEGRNDFKEGKLNIDEIKQIFTESTDKKLIPDGWLDIHLKLILWKLISYEIRFPNTLGKVCTVKNVIEQLKYRYDKELYNADRPVLRKIFEKDDAPSKTIVLCVAGIYVDGASVVSASNLNNIELLLTDGWYFIKATIDNMLSKLVYDEKIVVGCKIVTCGAELVNCEQGVAPWEDTSSIRLSISGNSTHPARWDAALGLRPSSALSRLAAVRLGGGKVARLRVCVARVYPRLYVEKFADGSTVTRSERLENQYQMKYEAEREAMIEKIYEEVEKEMSDQESQDSDGVSEPGNKRRLLDSGSQIAKLMKNSRDPMEVRAQLTSSQTHLLQDHVSKQRDKYLQAIQDKVQERLQTRNVVTLARGRIAGLEKDGERVTVTKGMLSIWKPNDEVLDIFKEGGWIEVTNVVPTAFRNSEIQLSAGRQSVFKPVKSKEEIFKPYLIALSRICHNIKDLSQNPSMTTDYNEIDTVGMIFLIDPSNKDFDSTKHQFQNVYLADIDKNLIGVNFWGGTKKFGYENILDTGQVVYCGNLQKRAGNTRKNIPQFRATEFAIFTKTPKNEKGREMVDEMNRRMFGLDRRKFCEDCIAVKQNYSLIRCLNTSENQSPYRFNTSDYNLGKHKAFIETPVGVKVKNKAEDFNLTGLDFESTFRQQDTQLSPKTLERKKKVNEKISKLKMYGEPPPLIPINILNISKNATCSYRSPLVKDEKSTSNSESAASVNNLQSVATPIKLPDDTVKTDDMESPIISNTSMNRTYIKRSNPVKINPVKLSFENVTEENVDKSVVHFAEEFEDSPPLSLE